jgi:hypothetical protein
MLRLTPDLALGSLGNKTCVGGVAMPDDDRLAFVFNDGTVVMIEGRAFLLNKQESDDILDWVTRSMARQSASMQTLSLLKPGVDPGARLTARREATAQERDRAAARTPIKTITDQAVEAWTHAEYPTVGGSISDVERRARTERITREVPEV